MLKFRLVRPIAGLAVVVSLLLNSIPALAAEADVGPTWFERTIANRWENDIAAFEKQDKEHPPQQNGILFVGSSSIRLWKLGDSFPDLTLVNRGFGGSQISDSICFAERIILPYKPRLIVFYAGDNDLFLGRTPERVCHNFIRLAQIVHEKLPETQIAFLSIKPSLQRWALIDKIRAANEQVRACCAQDARLKFIDVHTPMLGADGMPRKELFAADGLHLNAEGYAIWSSLVRPLLESTTAAAAGR
jgi:lysophospholipase L1-like esterase